VGQQLTIDSNGQLAAQFTVTGQGYTSNNFDIVDDGSGNALLSVAPSAAMFWVADANTQQTSVQAGTKVPGEASYLSGAYFYEGSDNVVVAAQNPSVWIVGGPGNDILVAQSGNAGRQHRLQHPGGRHRRRHLLPRPRGTAVTWDSVQNFNPGDLLVIWGWNSATTWYWQANLPACTAQLRADAIDI
jgi:hypothetical protein